MTDRQDGAGDGASSGVDARSNLEARWAALASRPSPDVPGGPAARLLNRVMVYTQASRTGLVIPLLDRRRSGLVIAGADMRKGIQLDLGISDLPLLLDPAYYDGKYGSNKDKYTATCEAPFRLPDDRLMQVSLGDVLDEQLAAGAMTGLTPTGFIVTTEVLKAAVKVFKNLRHDNALFVAPLHISLLDRAYIRQSIAILKDVDAPVALALGRQFDPLDQSKHIIPNLRTLVASVPVMPIRTDFNALDLIAHGAFAGAIGTGGGLRHVIDPTEKPKAFGKKGQPPDQSPSVLLPELVSFWKGSKIAEVFGARPRIVPNCSCQVCRGQKLSRFMGRDDQNEAIIHAIAVWSRWAADILDAPTMRDRAVYWRNLCKGALDHHAVFNKQLNRLEDELKPQGPIEAWARLPAWPTDMPANV
ncbi:hypothetical protein GCM10010402_08490 [Actinomadura luteofluorescens]|uniref:hypothetical protein n=1 Tax=Actinomadura luteofluorescens TaxID=46163 RepID=UPI00216482F7|nr:hypothetical protein [Actinomadura glauciflava]MCR3738399.1 hypothetical protein [Actinomadura glauciflava]